MPFEYITESADVDTLAEFLVDELQNILDSEQCNAAIETRLQVVLDIASAIADFNS